MVESVNYVRTELKNGKPIPDIVGELQKTGWTNNQIDQVLKEAFKQPNLVTVKAGKSTGDTSIAKANYHQPMDITKTFVVIGALLIILAVVIVLVTQWGNVAPVTRAAFVTLPMLILFAIAGALPHEKYHDIHNGTLITACLIFPFAIATDLYQLKIISEINPLLCLVSTLLAYLLLVLLEFGLKKKQFSILTIIYLYATVVFACGYFKLEILPATWILGLGSVLLSLFGLMLQSVKQENGNAYFFVGGVGAALIIPSAIISTLNNNGPIPNELNALLISVFGIIYLAFAMTLNILRLKNNNHTVYLLKRLLEELAPIIFLIPYLALGFDKVGYMIFALALSFSYLFVSIKIRIRTFLPIGALGLIVGIFEITGKYFVNSLGWPIVIFLAGFAMIGISFLVRRMSKLRQEQPVVGNFYGLGEDATSPVSDGKSKIGLGKMIGLIILVLIGVSFLLSFLVSSFISSQF